MRRLLTATVLVLVSISAFAPAAGASTQWAAANEQCGGMDPERGSGQMDASGLLYMACSRDSGIHYNNIGVFNQSGIKIRTVPLDFGDGFTNRAADVAPSPDGSILYVVRYDNRTTYRFARQGDGSYKIVNDGWALAKFPTQTGCPGGTCNPRGQFIATDANGDVYFSSGLWSVGEDGTEDALLKYHADGSFVTRFGRRNGGSWALGDSHGSFGGISVTANGSRVFATDINNSRVQRFDRQGDGSYRAVLAMGQTQASDPNRWGDCWGDGRLAAPYDVTMSARGELLVMNTTCFSDGVTWAGIAAGTVEVQRFGQDGSVRGSITGVSTAGKRVHGIGIDRTGHLHLPQGGIILTPPGGWSDAGADAGGGGPLGGTAPATGGGGPAGPPVGAPDTIAPTLADVTTPVTTTVNTISLAISATDNVAVTEVRVREDGTQYGWRASAATVDHTLADRLGDHTLVVQVRDAMGNVSGERSLVVKRIAPTPPPALAPAPAPAAAKPTVLAPVNVIPVAAGGGANVVPDAQDTSKPSITRIVMPAQLTSGRTVRIAVAARDDQGVAGVRFSSGNGRWSAWKSLRGAHNVMLSSGIGWKGVLIQVQDRAGNRSTPWFQTEFVAPAGARWYRGTAGADNQSFGRGTQHLDLSSFDGEVDHVSCGAGYDTVLAQPDDVVAADCEHVERVRMPTW